MDLTLNLTEGQLAGLQFVTDRANAVKAEDAPTLSAKDYLEQRIADLVAAYEKDMLASQEAERAALREQFAPTLNKVFALEPEKIQALASQVDRLIAQIQ